MYIVGIENLERNNLFGGERDKGKEDIELNFYPNIICPHIISGVKRFLAQIYYVQKSLSRPMGNSILVVKIA